MGEVRVNPSIDDWPRHPEPADAGLCESCLRDEHDGPCDPADPRPDDAPPLTGESLALVARIGRGDFTSYAGLMDALAAIERAARADAEQVVSDYPRVMAERDGWRRDAHALAGALRFHNETPAGDKRQCLPECIACDALERHEAMVGRAALAPRGGPR